MSALFVFLRREHHLSSVLSSSSMLRLSTVLSFSRWTRNEKTARDIVSGQKLFGGVDECRFKVHHQTHSSVQDCHVHSMRDPFDQLEQSLVEDLVLSSHQTIEERVRDVVLDEGVENIQLCVWSDKTSECPVSLDEWGCRKNGDRRAQPKNDDVISVVSQNVMSPHRQHLGKVD